MSQGVRVHGNATAEELAAVVAVMAQVERAAVPDRYTEWRRVRLAALRTGRPPERQRAR
jgi:hypothetical protein